MYRSGYFRQTVDADGFQQHIYPDYDFARLPVLPVEAPGGGVLTVPIDLPGRVVQAAVWKAQVGKVPVLMLDTDIPLNDPADRPITGVLYVRGREMRLCQEIVLGVGGVRALRALGIYPAVWHMNEGHVAFLGLERAREKVSRGDGLTEAIAQSALNTVLHHAHAVPAGNETFDRDLVKKYLGPWTQEVGADAEAALSLGAEAGSFNLTVLAIRLSSSVNGVSKLHGKVSSAMWRHLWPDPPESPVAYVTNGVHTGELDRAGDARPLRAPPGPGLGAAPARPRPLVPRDRHPRRRLWAAHRSQKERLIRFVRERVRVQSARHGSSPTSCEGWRASSTRAPSPSASRAGSRPTSARCSSSPTSKRLRKLLNDTARPVQMIFAGKAHPADRLGQSFISQLFELAQGEFRGKLVFIEDYDMEVGRMMTQGCDVWLNTPRRPQEASGTSGQKVPINGGINCSILDGWWVEGYRGDNGWAIGEENVAMTPDQQDAADALSLYQILEEQTVPLFFEKDPDGLRRKWIAMMKASVASCVAQFSAHRMVRDYVEQVYLPAAARRQHQTE
jgi:starch phosphorylase